MTMTDEPTVDESTGEVLDDQINRATPGDTGLATFDMPRLGLSLNQPPPDAIRAYRLQSPDIDGIIPALIKARKAFGPLIKDSKNDHLRSTYASLANVLAVTADGLTDNGLLLLQQTDYNSKDEPELVTRLFHESGQWFAIHYPLNYPVGRDGKPDSKDLGAALTYARRYAALAILGIAPEDPDGPRTRQQAQTQEGGVYKPEPQSEETIAASIALYTEFSAKIAEADTGQKLVAIGQELGAKSGLQPEQRRKLLEEYKARSAALVAQAEQAQRDKGKPTVSRLSDRPRPVPDNAARTKAAGAAHAAHRDGIKGAALAVGLILESPDDEQYITRQEYEAMVLVTPEQAAEAELDRQAEEAGA